MADKISGHASTRDGAAIHYTVHGDPGARLPRLALVHTLGLGEFVWDGVVERLADRAVVLTYDCRGHGASSKSPAPYSVEQFGHDLEDLLKHVGWTKAHVAGASMGGCVALQIAVSRPDLVQSLGLVDTTAWFGANAPEAWEGRAKQAEEKGMASLVEFQRARWFTETFQAEHADTVARALAAFAANDVPSFAASCRMLGAVDLRAKLPALRLPAGVIVGENDGATPPDMSREMVRLIPGATLEIIPQARHLSFIECPEITGDFLARLIAHVPTSVSA